MDTINLTLTIKRNGKDCIVLPLSADPPTLSEEDLGDETPAILSDSDCTFSLTGITSDRATATLFLEGEVLQSQVSYLTGERGPRIFFRPDVPAPLRDIIGIARLSVVVDFGAKNRREYFAPPVRVLLSDGPSADNIRAMSEAVSGSVGDFFAGESIETQASEDALEMRIRVLREIEKLYEEQYSYFRDDARYRLKPNYRVRPVEAMRGFTPAAAQWIASHPDELVRVRRGGGVRIGRNSWMPSHLPSRTTEASFDIIENRIVVGFISTVARDAIRMAAFLSDETAPDAPLLFNSWGAYQLIRAGCSKHTQELAVELRILGMALSRLSNLYRDALGLEPEVVSQLRPATAHFIETPAYRLVYGVMRNWFLLPPCDLKKIVERMVSVRSSRLYEYFVLSKLLSGIEGTGFTLVEKQKYDYEAAVRSPFSANNDANTLNTFRFERTAPEGRSMQTLTLWYQPYISGGRYAGENGIGLCRATSLGFDSTYEGMTSALKPSSIFFYTPDFLISVEENGARRWFVIDAKYSKLSSVKRHQTSALAFKYLLSMKPLTSNDHLGGLILLCGGVDVDDGQEGSIFDLATGTECSSPDLKLFRLNGLCREKQLPLLDALGIEPSSLCPIPASLIDSQAMRFAEP